MKTITFMLAVILASGLVGIAAADELPAAAQRIWAPAGDTVGLENHATATGILNDDHGDEARAASDEGVHGEWLGQGLFGWRMLTESSREIIARGLGGNVEGGGLAGDAGLWTTKPGRYRADITYHAHDLYGDRDSELRAPTFPYNEPAALAFTPHLDWRRGRVELDYHLSAALDLRLGVEDQRREGRKDSRLAKNPPAVQTVDMQSALIWLGGTARFGKLAADVRLDYQSSDDDRAYSYGHAYANETERYGASLDAAYDVTTQLRFHAGGRVAHLENTGTEAGVTDAGDTEGETDSAAYQLAVVSRLDRATTVRASARFDSHETTAENVVGGDVLYAADRERDRQQYQLVVGNRSLPRTALRLRYRYTSGESDEISAQGARPADGGYTASQTLDQESTRHDLSLRARTRLARHVKLKAQLRHTSLDVNQDSTWDTDDDTRWFGELGDHERTRTAWDLALQTRPMRGLPVDFGLRGHDQTFERIDRGTETTASRLGLFVNANWLASDRITVYGMASYGAEKYQLTDRTAPGGFEAFNVDATTLRLSPGASVVLTNCLQLEGWYEGVFFEDTGDESDSLDALEADRDRLQVRARWAATDRLAVSLGYARNEYDENRWDDYIQHLWSLSAHTTF